MAEGYAQFFQNAGLPMFSIRHDVYLHQDSESAILAKLDELQTAIAHLQQQGVQLMSRSEEVKAIVTRLDGASNELAKDLKELRDKIAAGTVGDAELAELDRVTSALEALGKDPENPIPEPPPAA